MLPIAILAGGLATRIKPISDSIPKSLVEIHGKPFLEWQLQLLEQNHCERVVICVSHKSELIEEFVRSRDKSGLDIHLSWDGSQRLGTGGALINARTLLGPAFMVLYGDSYLPVDFIEISNFFSKSNALSLMTVLRNTNGVEPSNVNYENDYVLKYDKKNPDRSMTFIDFGLNAFKAEVFDDYSTNSPLDLSDIQSALATRRELLGYEVNQRYYEVGSFQGIEDFKKYIGGN
jgi:MurNAc alpha-1-phosphate uridylyltransferase